MKFVAFSAARNKLTSFWGADLEKSIQFCLKHSKSLQCHWIKLFPNFLVQAIYLLDKRKQYNIKFEAFLAARNKLTYFAVADLESNIQVLAQTFQNPSVPQNKTPAKIFWFKQFTFQTKETNTI